MRRYGELSSGVERSSPRQFFPDYAIAMRGYDFREGQRRPHRIGARPRRTSSPLLPNLIFGTDKGQQEAEQSDHRR
jgi:hypothetical protein